MYKLFYTLFITLIISSCASTSHHNSAYSTYKGFLQKVGNKEYKSAASMLSQRNRTDLLKNSSIEDFSQYFPTLASLNSVLVREKEYYQSTKPKVVCLTINGFDSSREPTSINVEFVVEKASFKLDYAQIIYHATVKDFPRLATCPTRI